MALDAGNKQLVGICLRVLHEVRWGLFGGDGNEWYTFVRGLEPDNLGALYRTTGLVPTITLAFAAFGLLLLFGGGRRWAEKTQGTGN